MTWGAARLVIDNDAWRDCSPGAVRAVAAESLLLKHQLLISNRSRQRAPNLTSVDRSVLGLAALFVRPQRLPDHCAAVSTGGAGGAAVAQVLWRAAASDSHIASAARPRPRL